MNSPHWIVHEEHNGCIEYEMVDYVPAKKSSRALAEKIDGMDKAQAVAVLETMYARVETIDGSPRIFCYGGIHPKVNKRPEPVDLSAFEWENSIFDGPWTTIDDNAEDMRVFHNSIALFDCKTSGLLHLSDPKPFRDLMLQVPSLIADLKATREELDALKAGMRGRPRLHFRIGHIDDNDEIMPIYEGIDDPDRLKLEAYFVEEQ